MERTIKTLPATNGELYVTSGGRRFHLANYDGRIEIREHQTLVPILGKIEKGIKSITASFIVCGNPDYRVESPEKFVHSGNVFNSRADVNGERFEFDGLRFDESDPIENEIIFEITDTELIKKLLLV